MNRWLSRFERHFGKYAIENLPLLIIGGMAAVFVLAKIRPAFEGLLVLDLPLVGPPHWQVWRLFTYLFLPLDESPLWMVFVLYWVWLVGSNLEAKWGAPKLNAYYLVGMVGTTAAAAIAKGAAGNVYLNSSFLLAFATLFPDYEIYMLFVLRVRMKWIGLLTGGLFVYQCVTGNWAIRGAIVAALANYLLFFGGHLVALVRDRNLAVRQAARRAADAPAVPIRGGSANVITRGKVCAMCGASADDGADIRVCSCDKCGGVPRCLCLPHARDH